MDKFLSEEEKKQFLEYLKKNNLHNNRELASIFYVSPATMSVNLPKFMHNKPRKYNGKVPRLWKDLIELRVENADLRNKQKKMREIVE